jgi:hypothetical protein
VSLRIAFDLAIALRGRMRYAGVRRNPAPHLPQLDDEYSEGEALYNRVHNRGRPPGASAFRIHASRCPGFRDGRDCGCPEYLFDQVHPILLRELELHLPEKDRTPAAKALAGVMRNTELHTHLVLAAKEKLGTIYQSMRPIGTPSLRSEYVADRHAHYSS